MGIPFLWPFVKKKGYMANLLPKCPQNSRPPDTTFRVDILGSLYPLIRRTFLKHDPVTANTMFERAFRSLQFPPATTLLYIDGPSPEEKRATRELREARCLAGRTKANELLCDMEVILRQGKKLRKQHFRKLDKAFNTAFYFSADLRDSLAQYMRETGWEVIQGPSEADIQIARDCRPNDIVISGDSDSLVHWSDIKTIWRPLARGGYLEYDVFEVRQHLELSRAGLTALGIVCKNDYTSNLNRMGLATNYKIIQSMDDEGRLLRMVIVHYFLSLWQRLMRFE